MYSTIFVYEDTIENAHIYIYIYICEISVNI